MADAEVEGLAEPALFQHCVTVYEAMLARAEERVEEGATWYHYTGSLIKLFDELGLGQPYYTHVMRKLRQMDCCRQLQRGGGTSPSKWALLQPPSIELFGQSGGSPSVTQRHRKQQSEQMIRDLNVRVAALEEGQRQLLMDIRDLRNQMKEMQQA